jgi:hypothetical protein
MVYNGTFTSKVQNFINIIDARIHAVFNRNFFGVYEGIIEIINDEQATLVVSIPELNDARFENCRVAIPAISSTSKLIPTFNIGSHVIVMFTAFNLDTPIIIGQLSPINTIHSALNSTTMDIANGSGIISIDATGNISISGNNITLIGSTITANGEDLTNDDIGAL